MAVERTLVLIKPDAMGRGLAGEILRRLEARGLVLHTTDYVGQSTVPVKDSVALTSEPEVLQAIAAGRGPRRSLFSLGYAGWAPGQLEAEIDAGAWVTVPADEALVFDDDYAGKWRRAISRRGVDL